VHKEHKECVFRRSLVCTLCTKDSYK
jgi:hypothetical protein